MNNFNLKREGAIAILAFDQRDSKANVLNKETLGEFKSAIDEVRADSSLEALLIVSKKDNIFIAGADIKEIESITSPDKALEMVEKGQRILDELESLDKVTGAVINGACVGGGLELSLACKYRVASFGDKVKIGLPEVNLGIIPGFGGTQRLPRLVGLTRGLSLILPGKMVSDKDALKYGIVDRLFPKTRLIEDTIGFVNDILAGKARTKRKKKGLVESLIENTFSGRALVARQARKGVLKKTKGFYPAPLVAIDVITKTYGRGLKRGLKIEANACAELITTEISKNLIKVFYLNEEYKKLDWVGKGIKPATIDKCAIVGAGVMGGGIAQLAAYRDIPVRVKDITADALKTALKTAHKVFEGALKRRRIKDYDVEYKFGLISPTLTYKGFKNTPLVIEAVVENLAVKQKVFSELGNIVTSDAVLASNTSSLPIIDISKDTKSPERVVGLHFFNPVHLMPLIEVIPSKVTNDETKAAIIAFARSLGKIVIVVKDSTGFLVNRILLPYLNEAGHLLADGVSIERMDAIAKSFGMPMGPLELVDEIGIDVGYKVAKILEEAFGERMKVSDVLHKVKEKGLLGKKSKSGFYIHKDKAKSPNPGIYNIIKPASPKRVSDEDILKRLIYTMVNEAARCLDEKVADRPHTIDIGMIMGTGFPPFKAGLMRYADSVGLDNIAGDLKALAGKFGTRLAPCEYLLKKAERGEKFYS